MQWKKIQHQSLIDMFIRERKVCCLCDIMFEYRCELESKTITRAISDTIKTLSREQLRGDKKLSFNRTSNFYRIKNNAVIQLTLWFN
jgi:hypothetical protein